ncbi:unnamed protein product [Closterium sp. NIES-54]
MVTTTTPGGQRVSICTCTWTGCHLATFTRWPGSSLYTLATKPPQVAASALVSASGLVAPPCLCRLLSHQNLLWHHRLGHPSLPHLRGMHSRLLVSGLPRALPPLPPLPALPCLPCVEGRQRAAPHSSSFPPMSASLQTLHMDVWGPAHVCRQGRERHVLLVVDDYTHYTTVFPLRSKDEVPDVLIPWIRAVRLQLRKRFCQDLLVMRLHSDKGGEFSSDLLRDFCRGEGILQSFTLPASPQQNGISERRIGLVMEVARTSMIHVAAPHFLWPFAVRYAAHQLNLWLRVSLPETSPTLHWKGKVGNASVFRVWGSHAFVRDTSADKLSARAIPCVILGFFPDAPGWQCYHPTSRRVFPSQNVMFDESVHFLPSLPLLLCPSPTPAALPYSRSPSGKPPPPQGPAFSGAASGGAESGDAEPVRAEPGGAEPAGAKSVGAEFVGAESGGAEPQGTASSGGSAGASPRLSPRPEHLSLQQLREWFARRTRLRSRARGTGAGGAGATSLGGAGAAGPGGARTRGGTGASSPGGTGAGGAAGIGAGDTGAGGAGPGGAGAVGAGFGDTGRPRPYFVPLIQQVLGLLSSTALTPALLCPPPDQSQPSLQPASPLRAPSPYTEQTGGLTEHREPVSRPALPVPAVRTGRRVPRPHPPLVPGTHHMALRPSSVPQGVPFPSPPASSLADGLDPESDLFRAASLTVPCLLATVVTDPSFESATTFALVAELIDFAAACCLDYAASLVAESESASPPSVGGECALGMDVLEDRQENFECFAAGVRHLMSMLIAPEGDPDAPDIPTLRSYAEAIMGPYSSQWQTAMDAEMASWKSTCTYVDALPPPGANIVDGMWIFRVKRPPGSPPAFKARYVARGFSQREGVDFFQNFSPTPKMTTLRHNFLIGQPARGDLAAPPTWFHWVVSCRYPMEPPTAGLRSLQVPCEWHDTLRTTLAALGFAPSTADPSLFLRTDTSLLPFYILVYVGYLVFASADTEALALVKSELQKRHTCTDLGELRSYLGLQISRDGVQRTITLIQSHMVHQVLQRFGFGYSLPQSTPLPTCHSLSAPTSDESVEPSGPYPELVGCLMYLMTCTRPDLAYPLSILARYVAPGRHRPEHWEAANRVLRYLCSTSGMGLVLGGRGPVFLIGHADASWVDDLATQRSSQGYTCILGSGFELRWLTYLLTYLGERPRSSPVLYVDNKAMIALCQEHRLEHRTKHIALRFFLARELQHRGQLGLAYVATRANTADIFTKALQSGDH